MTNLLPFFTSPWFFIAGVICALGPIIIHFLNRRRYVVVDWAAMDFLREALRRNRRILELRDVALLILRTLAVLLVGTALARPLALRGVEWAWLTAFFALLAAVGAAVVCIVIWSRPAARWLALSATAAFLALAGGVTATQLGAAPDVPGRPDGSQPIHAVVLLDNSLSMGYQSLAGTLLDAAKERAKEYLAELPPGSRASVVPLCGSRRPISVTPYPSLDDAGAALDQIELADRSTNIGQAVNAAQKACEAAPDLAKRIVLFTDQQQNLWQGYSGEAKFPEGVRMQVASVSADEPENTWIESIRVQDGLADVQTPATIIAEVRHQGADPREVQVTLESEGATLAARTVTLQPGEGAREVAFQHTFNAAAPQPGKPALAAVRAVLPPDRLAADDARDLIVPVVAALPVVFVDQYGAQLEDPLRNRYGETRRLRKLMAPGAARDDEQQLVQVRHVTPEDLSQDMLSDARLTIVAGLEDPGVMTPLLREYVEQGGQLVIAAGGEFDPAAWTRDAWLDGDGILPSPLKLEAIGALPDEAPERLKPFSLAFDSLRNQRFFHLAGVPEDDLVELYSEPLFFKAVQPDVSEQVLEAVRAKEAGTLRAPSAESQSEPMQPADGARSEPATLDWLVWSAPDVTDEFEVSTDDPEQREANLRRLADRAAPRVAARFENGAAFLVERRIGRGRVFFVSTGLYSAWNTMHLTNAYLVYNRLLRGMIEDTLPRRNFSTVERIAVPLPTAERDVAVLLLRPSEKVEEMLDLGYIGQERRGVTIDNPLARGLYRLTAVPAEPSAAGEDAATPTRWEMPLAVSGPAEESELTRISREQFAQYTGESFEWVGPTEDISLAGIQLHGQNWWRWLIVAALAMLLLEMAILTGTERARAAGPAS
jgi:hypothetical protein